MMAWFGETLECCAQQERRTEGKQSCFPFSPLLSSLFLQILTPTSPCLVLANLHRPWWWQGTSGGSVQRPPEKPCGQSLPPVVWSALPALKDGSTARFLTAPRIRPPASFLCIIVPSCNTGDKKGSGDNRFVILG